MNLYRQFRTQAEIDEQYNFEEIYPDRDEIISAQFARSHRVFNESGVRTAQFGPTVDEYLDIYPALTGPAPIFVFIHGGYWYLDVATRDFALTTLAPRENGMAAVIPDYSIAPKVTIDEITRQSRAAVAWIYANAHTFGGDPDQIYVAGHSAGGHQVAMLLSTDWEVEYGLPNSTIKAGIAVSGLFDLRPFAYSWLAPRLLLTSETLHRQSPIFTVREGAPPLLLATAEHEPAELHRQTQAFLQVWESAGNEGRSVVIEGATHLNVIEGFGEHDSQLWKETSRLLPTRTTPADTSTRRI
ncbi:arylformamidase [Microbacterium sp. BE35]|uniref:alpha/beta hydrolase n=1 Tax=Microbacterium sp. BE35 TaxID=2817773 RepID=UPI00285CF51D|nr:alpha/beta hydrolase [Microbacterium sp. BE35]MDR7188187.1 arylformamidase [Microbacterium sp. BE35]